jgi:hypothetical protein
MGMHEGSYSATLAGLSAGDYIYIETSFERHNRLMHRLNPPKTRRPREIADMEFTTRLFTAVGPKASDVRYLVRVERIA